MSHLTHLHLWTLRLAPGQILEQIHTCNGAAAASCRHPDKHSGSEQQAVERLRAITAAYARLHTDGEDCVWNATGLPQGMWADDLFEELFANGLSLAPFNSV